MGIPSRHSVIDSAQEIWAVSKILRILNIKTRSDKSLRLDKEIIPSIDSFSCMNLFLQLNAKCHINLFWTRSSQCGSVAKMWSPYHAIYWTIIGLFQNTPHQAIVEHNLRFIASKNLVIVNKVLGPNGTLSNARNVLSVSELKTLTTTKKIRSSR